MGFKRKTSTAPSQNFYQQDIGKDICYSSGQSPVDSNGRTFDNSVQLNWPYSPATPDGAMNPRSNPAMPPYLGSNGRGATRSNKVSSTLG